MIAWQMLVQHGIARCKLGDYKAATDDFARATALSIWGNERIPAKGTGRKRVQPGQDHGRKKSQK